MNTEKQKILEMLENGQITATEAAQLLDAIGGAGGNTSDRAAGGSSSVSSVVVASNTGNGSKKLRVKVNGLAEQSPINVDVAIPLALARVADSIIANCMPTAAHEELSKQGINIKELKIGEMIDTLESLDEDIVNVDIDNEDAKMKVRVYVQ